MSSIATKPHVEQIETLRAENEKLKGDIKSIADRAAKEQMERDCKVMCEFCGEGFDIHAPEYYDDGEEWFHIEPYEEYGQERERVVFCGGSKIREAFRANEADCQHCGGKGFIMEDSGAQSPWGDWIEVDRPCMCQEAEEVER